MAFQFELLTLQNLGLWVVRFMFAAAVSSSTLFNRACDEHEKEFADDYASESRPYASLVQVPVQFAVGLIKERLPVIKYSSFLERSEGQCDSCEEEASSPPCAVCLAVVNASDEVRELCNCCHIFHRVCLDGWIDQGQITCPLCRSKIWPDQNNGKSECKGGDPWREERMIYLFGEDLCFI